MEPETLLLVHNMVLQHSESIFFKYEQVAHLTNFSRSNILSLNGDKVEIFTSCRYLSTKTVHLSVFCSSHLITKCFTTTEIFLSLNL